MILKLVGVVRSVLMQKILKDFSAFSDYFFLFDFLNRTLFFILRHFLTQIPKSLILKLSHALSGDANLLTHLFKCKRVPAIQSSQTRVPRGIWVGLYARFARRYCRKSLSSLVVSFIVDQ